MTEKLRQFLAGKNISAHTFAAIAIAAMTLYTQEPLVTDLVDTLLAQHPKLSKLLAVLVLVWARYSRSNKGVTP